MSTYVPYVHTRYNVHRFCSFLPVPVLPLVAARSRLGPHSLVVRQANLRICPSVPVRPSIRGPKHGNPDHHDQIRQISSGIPSVAAETSAIMMDDGLREKGKRATAVASENKEARRDTVRRILQWPRVDIDLEFLRFWNGR